MMYLLYHRYVLQFRIGVREIEIREHREVQMLTKLATNA